MVQSAEHATHSSRGLMTRSLLPIPTELGQGVFAWFLNVLVNN